MKKLKIILLSTFIIIIIIASGYYIKYHYIPEKIFEAKIVEYDEAVRSGDKDKVLPILSKQSDIYQAIEYLHLITSAFEKFERENVILKVSYFPNMKFKNKTFDAIFGRIEKKAKIDGEYRLFPQIMLIKEKDEWVFMQFSLPDYQDY